MRAVTPEVGRWQSAEFFTDGCWQPCREVQIASPNSVSRCIASGYYAIPLRPARPSSHHRGDSG